MKRILVIAGTDSSGGAGLEADQKVIAAHGCYAMTAQAALTAQNTLGVNAIHEVPSYFVEQQIDACITDIGVDVVKTGTVESLISLNPLADFAETTQGMLATAKTVAIVAKALRRHRVTKSVIDPVMVASSGSQLLSEDGVEALCKELLPQAYLVTPNIPEAQLMLKAVGREEIPIHNREDLSKLAAAVLALGPTFCLLKGGHVPLNSKYEVAETAADRKIVTNVLVGANVHEFFESPFQDSKNTHGTGCSLASAIACHLALGALVAEAVGAACRYVDAGIKTSPNFGGGFGPLNHFHSIQILPFAPGNFVDYVLRHPKVKSAWHDFTQHEFVRQMGDGSLPTERFKYYMIQDYLYLVHFARANALAGYKAKSIADIASAAAIVTHIHREMDLHINECSQLGLTREEIEQHEESQACTAYSRYILDIGQSEDWLALQISLLPCLLGYHVIAKQLDERQKESPPQNANHYRTWINNYIAEDFRQAVETGCALVEKHAVRQSPIRIEELVHIFVHATKMETGFWNMAAGK